MSDKSEFERLWAKIRVLELWIRELDTAVTDLLEATQKVLKDLKRLREIVEGGF